VKKLESGIEKAISRRKVEKACILIISVSGIPSLPCKQLENAVQ
jgi:hypothetical protein